jgi:alpha-tubulin suppressor-like RCC1 family protein
VANELGTIGPSMHLHCRIFSLLCLRLSVVALAVVCGYASADRHSCLVSSTGGLKCWGDNTYGQLGDGTNIGRPTPMNVLGLASGVTQVGVGWDFSCALVAGGVKCWGGNEYGMLGDGTTTDRNFPANVSGMGPGSGITQIAVGDFHACAVMAAGNVKCWGQNFASQLGDGTTEYPAVPVDVQGLSGPAIQIAAGNAHTCAIITGGNLQCWGANSSGQLGDGTFVSVRPQPVNVIGLGSGVDRVTLGYGHTCAVTHSSTAKCWGWNNYGQLGNGTLFHSATPQDITGLPGEIVQLAAGFGHTCASSVAGKVWCWGSNASGELGTNTIISSFTAASVENLSSGVRQLSAGLHHTCALLISGGTKCWGSDTFAQLGTGYKHFRSIPSDVIGLSSGIAQVAMGTSHTCALSTVGAVKCWGLNSDGQLGDGLNSATRMPVNVAGLGSGIVQISASGNQTCALNSQGSVLCWGQLFNGAKSSTPTSVSGLPPNVAFIEAGNGSQCILTSDGGAKCWGANNLGQLGIGSTAPQTAPADVYGLTSGVTQIARGFGHTCGALATGEARCWGANTYGQVGIGAAGGGIEYPLLVSVVTNGLTQIEPGSEHTCAVVSGGAKCWGKNFEGQVGYGDFFFHYSPVEVVGLESGVTSVATGMDFSCATVSAGVKCWGSNIWGMLGDGTTTQHNVPVSVSGLGNGMVKVFAGSSYHACALNTGGGLKCWGWNQDGQLGNGEAGYEVVPVDVLASPNGVAITGVAKLWAGNPSNPVMRPTRNQIVSE